MRIRMFGLFGLRGSTLNKITNAEFAERLAWPLDRKIQESWHRMEQWYNWCRAEGHTCSIAFSGGLDSTVLRHLYLSNPMLKTQPIRLVFADTGIDYPEIREFVRSIENVVVARPKKTFPQIIKEYGYPIISKRIAQYVGEIQRTESVHMMRLRLTGFRKNGLRNEMSMIPQKWQFLAGAPFKISDRCCYYMKKLPMKCMGCPMVGVRATEAKQREKTYLMSGCNAYSARTPRSWPIAFWTDDDIREYIRSHDVQYCLIYDMGYTRTGCFPCAFGVHLEPRPNRFELMRKTHPRLWDFCMDTLGLQKIFEWMNNYLSPTQRIHFGIDAEQQVLFAS